MIGFNPRNEDFVPGFRFLTGGWGPPLFEPFGSSAKRTDLLMEVVSRDGMAFTARDQHGTEHDCLLRHHDRPDLGKDVRRMNREILWAGELPKGPIGEIAAFADVLLQSGYRDPALLLLCRSVGEDGTATCDLIHTARRGGCADWRMDDVELPGTTVGNAWFSEERILIASGAARQHSILRLRPDNPFLPDRNPGPGPSWNPVPYAPKPGDLFAAVNFVTTFEGPLTILSAHLLPIAHDMDREKVGEWLPAIPEPTRRTYTADLPIGTRMDLEMEVERAHARSQPDEIIVISVPLIAPKSEGEVHLTSLSHTGIRLHEVDSLDDHLYGTDLEPGVWIGVGITWHDCGEDGAEWSADWRRATREDLQRHGIGFDEIAASWEDLSDVETDAADIEAMVDRDVEAEAEAIAARSAPVAAETDDGAPEGP